MEAQKANAHAQEASCRALGLLAANTGTSSGHPGVAKRMVEAVVGAIRRHPNSIRLQEAGCDALLRFSKDLPDTRELLCGVDSISAVLTTLQSYIHFAHIQETACGILTGVAANETGRARISDQNGVSVILSAMRQHVTDAKVQEVVCRTLFHLVELKECRLSLVQCGGVNTLLSAMEAFRGNESVLEYACWVLQKLSEDVEERRHLSDLGVAAAVLDAISGMPEKVLVLEAGCWALFEQSKDARGRDLIGERGGVDVLLKSMRTHRRPRMQEMACQVLFALASSPEYRPMIVQSGGVGVVLDVMGLHPAYESLQTECCKLLVQLGVDNPLLRTDIRKQGGEIIADVAERFKRNDKIRQGCELLLRCLDD